MSPKITPTLEPSTPGSETSLSPLYAPPPPIRPESATPIELRAAPSPTPEAKAEPTLEPTREPRLERTPRRSTPDTDLAPLLAPQAPSPPPTLLHDSAPPIERRAAPERKAEPASEPAQEPAPEHQSRPSPRAPDPAPVPQSPLPPPLAAHRTSPELRPQPQSQPPPPPATAPVPVTTPEPPRPPLAA